MFTLVLTETAMPSSLVFVMVRRDVVAVGKQISARIGAFGTSLRHVLSTMVFRPTFHGWLLGRTPENFPTWRNESLGTVILSVCDRHGRIVHHGWLAMRLVRSWPNIFKQSSWKLIALVHCNMARAFGFQLKSAERAPANQPASVSNSDPESYHISVMPKEIIEWMDAGPKKLIIDGTLGGGGHSRLLLETGAMVLGVDRDPAALAHAAKRLRHFGDQFEIWQGNFAELSESQRFSEGQKADGLLLDLGVSSHQLDIAERGFSFRGDGPLDMRMGPDAEFSAADIVNRWSEEELCKLLREYGEEPQARRIAAAITAKRKKDAFETTLDLADCIEKTIGRYGKTHPATRSFQAIRMVVNDELGSLERALKASSTLLKAGGRLLVITFHSLEDRLVKKFLVSRSQAWIDRPEWPERRPNPDYLFKLPHRKAITPTPDEIKQNPRSRSAKLRVAQLLETTAY